MVEKSYFYGFCQKASVDPDGVYARRYSAFHHAKILIIGKGRVVALEEMVWDIPNFKTFVRRQRLMIRSGLVEILLILKQMCDQTGMCIMGMLKIHCLNVCTHGHWPGFTIYWVHSIWIRQNSRSFLQDILIFKGR